MMDAVRCFAAYLLLVKVTTEGEGGDDHLSGLEGRAWSSRTLEDLRVQLEHFAKDRCKTLLIGCLPRVNTVPHWRMYAVRQCTALGLHVLAPFRPTGVHSYGSTFPSR